MLLRKPCLDGTGADEVAGLEPNAGFAGAGLDEAAGVVGEKPGKAGFAILGFSGLGSAGEIGSYVGGLVGVTSVLVVT